MSVCYFCKKALDIRERVMRKDVCPACGKDLRCCVQCRFHDPGYHNQCREPKAGMVREREKANLCDYFSWSGAEKGDPRPFQKALIR